MLKHIMLSLVAAAVLVGCGKEEGSSGGGSGSGSGGGSSSSQTPEEFYETARKTLASGDGKAVWNMLSKASKKKLLEDAAPQLKRMKEAPAEQKAEIAKMFDTTAAELDGMSAEDFLIKSFTMLAKDPKEKEKLEKTVLVKAEAKDDRATFQLKEPDGKEDWSVAVKEDGAWKMDIPETEKLQKEKGTKD